MFYNGLDMKSIGIETHNCRIRTNLNIIMEKKMENKLNRDILLEHGFEQKTEAVLVKDTFQVYCMHDEIYISLYPMYKINNLSELCLLYRNNTGKILRTVDYFTIAEAGDSSLYTASEKYAKLTEASISEIQRNIPALNVQSHLIFGDIVIVKAEGRTHYALILLRSSLLYNSKTGTYEPLNSNEKKFYYDLLGALI